VRAAIGGSLAALVVVAAVASAGTVSQREDMLRFTGADGRDSLSIVSRGQGFRVTANRRLRVRPGCRRRASRRAFCPRGPLEPFLVNVRLHAGNDSLKADVVPEGEGNDFDHARASGGPGDDRLVGIGDTLVNFFGDNGNDRLVAGPESDVRFGSYLRGGTGNDDLTGGGDSTIMYGGVDDDILRALAGRENELYGGEHDDTLLMGEAAGRADGGAGNDVIGGGSLNSSSLVGDEGDDRIDAAAGPGRDIVSCGSGVDAVVLGPEDVFANRARDDAAAAAAGCESVARL